MAHIVHCVRFKEDLEGLNERPFDNELGQKIYDNVSKKAWMAWLEHQKMLFNHYHLQPWAPEAQQFLAEELEKYFFGEGSEAPPETPPEKGNLYMPK